MRVTFGRAAALFALILPAGGCGTGTPADTAAPGRETPAGSKPTVTVKDVGIDALGTALDGYKDKVVVVDFWATWCGPCVKKFPHLVELHHKYADKGLVCVSVSMDKWEQADEYAKKNGREKVVAFLTEKGATFPNFIAADPDHELKKFEARFGEFPSIPHMTVFDKAGRKVWDSESGAKTDDAGLDKLIAAELAK